jgi:hypothetical protein
MCFTLVQHPKHELRADLGRKQFRLPGQEALNAKHSQPPSPQLIKVALCA